MTHHPVPYGRVTTTVAPNAWDGDAATAAHETDTTYSPSTGWPTTVTTTDYPIDSNGNRGSTKLRDSSVALDPSYGNVTRATNYRGLDTTRSYDALGRLTDVYTPAEQGTTSPAWHFDYHTDGSSSGNYVFSSQLQGEPGDPSAPHLKTWTYVDGWGRTREVQRYALGDDGDEPPPVQAAAVADASSAAGAGR